ncbi:type II secretion system F family protein [Candidatus Neomarinimicrobiota bacterium]
MPQYQYRAIDSDGIITDEIVDATSSRELKKTVLKTNVFPLTVKRVRQPLFNNNLKKTRYRIKSQELENFTSQLYVMVAAGVPLIKSLKTISKQVESDKMKSVVDDIIERINRGEVFSKSLSHYPKVFNYLYVNMIRVGETTGSLDVILEHIRNFLHWDIAIKRKVKAAMRYPMMVVALLVIAFIGIIGFVTPMFADLFASADVVLPLPTRIMLGLSTIITEYWLITSIVILVIILSIRYYISRPGGAYRFDVIKLFVPVFKDIVLYSTISRFAHILETLNRSGITIINALEILEHTLDNRVIAKDISNAKELVLQGVPLAEALSKSKHIPAMTTMMIDTGEQSGALDDMLHSIAEQYDTIVKTKIEGLAAAIEPILTVVIGGFLLLFALSIFLPMWNLVEVIK